MRVKDHVTAIIDPSGSGKVERAAVGRAIPWADHAGDLATRSRLEDSHSQTDIRLARDVDSLLGRYNSGKEKVALVVQAGTEEHACERSARRSRSDIRHQGRSHRAGKV